jgi:proline iminopeptidase
MLTLYPDIKPYAEHRLPVDVPHVLYVEESGNPDGIPVVFLHGGPGAGCSPRDRRFFDPEKYRVVLFDQRGAGRSSPHAELAGNATAALVDDLERVRLKLGIERWVLFGGSWGSTLALLYAQQHPERVLAVVLRGVFLARRQDVLWFYQQGASRLFPDHWQDYLHPIEPGRREDLVSAYYELLTGDNELARMGAAKAWSSWEAHCATLRPSPGVVHHLEDPHVALAMARIEAHYCVNDFFIRENQILDDAERLLGIPATIVHGRYDMICPLENAFTLHKRWPDSELHIVRDAGHAASEPGTVDALVQATRRLADRFADIA